MPGRDGETVSLRLKSLKYSWDAWNQAVPTLLAFSGPAKSALTAAQIVARCQPVSCVLMIAHSYSPAIGRRPVFMCCRSGKPKMLCFPVRQHFIPG
jgi:hypothetical protein